MQKGKAAASPPAMILQTRAPQQNARGPPPSQQRSDDFNPRQAQPYQMPPGQMHQNLVMQMPGPPQGQPRLPNQQPFYPNQRPMRIPRHQPQNNQPMYSSPSGGPPMAVQMMGPPATTQFMPPGQHPPFMTQPVDFSLPMGNPAQMQYHRPQQPMQGQFAPVSGPSQPQGSPVYQVGQPTPPMYIARAPPGPMTGVPQYQTQTFEPRTRERKIIQIKDPNSNKDVTQEIRNRQPSGSLTGSTGGTPNNITPDISGQSSSSSTPPLTLQQQAEANVRAQFAAQVAATLANSEDKPKKPEVIIQKAPVNNKAVVDTVQLTETPVSQKNEVVKETRTNPATGIDTQLAERSFKTQPKEMHVKTRPKEAVQGSKLSERVSGDIALGSKSLVSSVNVPTSAKVITSNVRLKNFTADEVRKKEAQQSSVRKAPVNNKAFVNTVQLKDTTVTQKNEVVKETRTDLATGTDTQILPETNVRAQFAAQVAAKGEPERELTEVHCDESKISLEHLEELRMGEYIRSDLTTQLMEMEKQLGIKDEQLRVTKEQLRRSEDQLRVKDEQQQTLQRQLTTLRAEKETQVKENEKLQDQLSMKLQEFTDLEKEFRDSVQDQVDLKRELSVANEKLSKYETQLITRDWIISREEIEIMLDNCLGDGGYGKVFRGRYRGFVVAVKTLKDFSLKDGGRDLFEREMDIASRCRHPCLLQFIGATQEEKPLFVTELMELSLRKLLKERPLSEKEIVVISVDVAHALNYLHNREIVHRDVSSANVLLWKQNDQWRGKLGDYGTVKFLQEIMTKSPGAMIYSAPEAGSPFNQTVKIDVYSFGVLFCEMFTRKIPVFDERKKHVDLVPNRPGREFQDLVLRCTEEDPTRRPSMETVIKKMETFITTVQNLLEKSS